jgi:hypothetical protein
LSDDIDQILSEIEQPSEGIPMTGDEAAPAQEPAAGAPSAEPAPSPWDPKPWEFDWNGKKVAPDSQEKARTWMSQGYNYSQRMAEINRQRKEIEDLSGRYRGYDRYSEVDQYAKQNPQWWDFVEKQWAQRGQQQPQGQNIDPAMQSVLAPLQQELAQLKEWRDQQLQERQKQEEQRFDEVLSKDIASIREQNPNIDFDAVDQSGKTLELRILEHANQIGTASFRAAFRDYLHDQILESAKAQKLAAEAKAPQVAKERGILGVSPTPKKAPSSRPAQVKGRSWDDLAKVAMEDLGIA